MEHVLVVDLPWVGMAGDSTVVHYGCNEAVDSSEQEEVADSIGYVPPKVGVVLVVQLGLGSVQEPELYLVVTVAVILTGCWR